MKSPVNQTNSPHYERTESERVKIQRKACCTVTAEQRLKLAGGRHASPPSLLPLLVYPDTQQRLTNTAAESARRRRGDVSQSCISGTKKTEQAEVLGDGDRTEGRLNSRPAQIPLCTTAQVQIHESHQQLLKCSLSLPSVNIFNRPLLVLQINCSSRRL